MTKSALAFSACLTLALFGCSKKPEAALTEEPATLEHPLNVERSDEPILQVKPSAPKQKTQPAKPAKNIPAQVQLAQTSEPQITSAPQPLRTPFNVRRCINMGNALEAPNEGDWGYSIRAKDFRAVAISGFDTVRIPIRWDAHTAHRAPYKIDPTFMARVQQVTREAQAAGLGVIIDVHHYEDLMSQTDRHEARFLAIWDQISTAFSGAPDNVYFEIINEPTLEMSPARLNALYAKTVPVIRKTNPTRKLIMGGNSWNSVEALASVRFPKDPNIVATFHDYGPHDFTHQGAAWMDPIPPMGRKWGGRKDEAELSETYNVARAFAKKTGLPILVGEFGVIDKVPQARRNQWVKRRRMTIEAEGYSWCAWDFSGAFKSYDTDTEKWLPGAVYALTAR